jgi:hypothetical protein
VGNVDHHPPGGSQKCITPPSVPERLAGHAIEALLPSAAVSCSKIVRIFCSLGLSNRE